MKFKSFILTIVTLMMSTQVISGNNKKEEKEKTIINLNSVDRIPNSYIVIYKSTAVSEASSIAKSSGSEKSLFDINIDFTQSIIESSNSTLTSVYGNSIYGATITNTAELLVSELLNDDRIKNIYANTRIYTSEVISSPQSGVGWGLDRIDQSIYPLDSKYYFSNTAPNVNVFIIDTGIDQSHTEFRGRNIQETTVTEVPCFTPLCSIVVIPESTDFLGHGTHVAGIIAGEFSGVAKDVNLYSYKIFDTQGRSSIGILIRALDLLYNQINSENLKPAIVNMSISAQIGDILDLEPLRSALESLNSLGVHMVGAAGNNSNAISSAPANSQFVISVGATTMEDGIDTIASISNYGLNFVDIFAPGVAITSAAANTTSSLIPLDGTSMAAPFVSGALALYLQDPIHRNESPEQAKTALLASATTVMLTAGGQTNPRKLLNSTTLSPLPILVTPDEYDDISIRGYTDDYEGDAETIIGTVPQIHNFHDLGDQDWTMVWVQENASFEFKTSMIDTNSATKFEVYKVTDIVLNPNFPNSNRFIINNKILVASGTNNTPKIISGDAGFLYVMKVVSSTGSFGNNTDYRVMINSISINADQYDDIGIRGYVDDIDGEAVSLESNIPQIHNFHDLGDQDWTMVWIPINLTFNVTVNMIGHNSDAKLSVYKVTDIILNPSFPNTNRFIINGKTLVGSDNSPGNLSLNINADGGFLYVMKVESNINSFGYGTDYEIILQ